MKKKSTKLVGIALLFPFAVALVVMIYLRFLVGSELKNPDFSDDEYSDDIIEKKVELADFSKLRIRGSWKIEVEQGEEYSIVVRGPENQVMRARIDKSEKTLHLKDRFFGDHGRSRLSARITMPQLESLKSNGTSKIRLYDIKSEELELEMNGSGNAMAINSTIKNLEIDCKGASEVDFSDSRVVNAEIDLIGASEVEITMAGGELSGSLTGGSKVIYFGEVSDQDIRTTGGSRVKKR